MAHRLGRLVGVAAFVLVVLRLGRVLTSGPDTPDWRVVAVAAAVLGGLVTWAGLSYRLSLLGLAALHLVGMAVVVERVAASGTLSFGIVPGAETLPTLASELGYALDLIRFGAPPVLAVGGLVALVAVGMWLLGAAWTWGAATQRTWTGIVPPLGFYLYLAVVDRADTGLAWMLSFGALIVAGLIATTMVTRTGTGRVRDGANRPLPRRRAGASAVVGIGVLGASLLAATAGAGEVPAAGWMDWRNPGGATSGLGGGVAFNPFVSLQQDVLSQSDDPVFVAKVSDGAPDNRQMYWKLISLEDFDGVRWAPAELDSTNPFVSGVWENPDLAYRGPTAVVQQAIQIRGLRQEFLPYLYSPFNVESESDLINSGLQTREDGSLVLSGRTPEGLTYIVTSEIPMLDVAQLASVDGELSPLFAEAAAMGSFDEAPVPDPATTRPAAISEYMDLPDDLSPTLDTIAEEITASATTPFERAVQLESFFRDGGNFTYDAGVSTGHSALDLAAWLTDPESPNYRTGYCEQFAAAMGVLGRLVGLPTRVVIGFTPGETDPDSDLIIVRQRNAHAWVEVWFDSQGWVRFDPTPRSDGANPATTAAIGFDPAEVALPSVPDASEVPQLEDDIFVPNPNVPIETAPTGARSGAGTPTWVWVFLVAIVMALAVPAVKSVRRRRRMARVKSGDITAAWDEIVDRLTDLGNPPPRHVTPVEFATETSHSLLPLARAYSAAIYGTVSSADAPGHLDSAEQWLFNHYDGRSRAQARFNPRSLTRRP